MAAGTGIEWTDATWNPVTGCTRVSKGCDNCYAATLAGRLLRDAYLARAPVVDSDITRADPFAVRIWPERLTQPEKWREPRMIFVNSMSDLFHAHCAGGVCARNLFEGCFGLTGIPTRFSPSVPAAPCASGGRTGTCSMASRFPGISGWEPRSRISRWPTGSAICAVFPRWFGFSPVNRFSVLCGSILPVFTGSSPVAKAVPCGGR